MSEEKKDSKNVRPIYLILIVLLIGFFMTFHIVRKDGSTVTIIPKANISFSDTIVDLDQVIQSYNNRSAGEKLRGENINKELIRKLKEKGLIKLK